MGADQFLLTWNNHRSNFAEVFTQLRVQDQLVDVTLLCDGGSYPAHRLVLAACSPYFHQLFTRLPTQHPLIYLRDVKQAELEALLEFIYRGEVSVANSELTGLIKIAESLRIKGLGDVSQRDQHHPHTGEKRPSPSFSPSSPPTNHNSNPRPKKAPRLSTGNGDSKGIETSFASLLSPANSYGHAVNKSTNNNNHNNNNKNKNSEGFAQLMDSGCPEPSDQDLEEDRTTNLAWESSLSESKLRSCLEGLDAVSAAQSLAQSVAHTVAQSINIPNIPRAFFTSTPTKVPSSKRETFDTPKETSRSSSHRKHHHEASENKKGRNSASINHENEKELKIPKEAVKTEPNPDQYTATPAVDGEGGSEGPTVPAYENNEASSEIKSDLANPLLASYRQMLGLSNEDRSFSPLIPTTVQEQQQAPSPTGRESRSLTCNLCGATIKHIANFRRHMKQHLNPRRFPCPWCSAAFGRKDNLKTHTRKHHPAEVEAQEAGGGQRSDGGTNNTEGTDNAKVPLKGLNGLGSDSGDAREGSQDDCEREDGDREDSSDHHEGLVIAEDTEEEEEEDEDSHLQEDGQ